MKKEIKKLMPNFMLKGLGKIYSLKDIPHYWLPYAFKDGEALPPKSLSIWVTWKCNCRCLMCPFFNPYTDHTELFSKLKQKYELTTEEMKNLIDDSYNLGVRSFSISGGEPFLRQDMGDIIKYIKSKNVYCSVFSNGIIMNDKLASELIDSKLDCINLSLDGDEKTHNEMRGNPQAFEKLMKCINLIESKKRKVGSKYPILQFNTTITAKNQQKLVDVMDVANKFKMNVYFGNMYYTEEWMVEKTKELLDMGMDRISEQDLPKELRNVDINLLLDEIKRIKQKEKEYGISAFILTEKKEDLYNRFYKPTHSYTNKCFSPWQSLIVDSFGDVYPCRLYVLLGNVKEQKLSKIWNGDRFIEFRKKVRKAGLFPMCAKCCNLNMKTWSYLPKIKR